MNLKLKGVAAIAAVTLLGAGTASAQLDDGLASEATSVFISVVERDATNTATKNLVIDTGLDAFDLFDGTALGWSTTDEQSAAVLAFLNAASGTVSFNLGAGLTTVNSDNYGIATTGTSQGPGFADFLALNTGRTNLLEFINNANGGTFVDGVLQVPSPSDPGFHQTAWGNSFGGAIQPSNEVAFGNSSQIQGWRLVLAEEGIINSVLAPISSDAATGSISIVPVPAAVWLFGSALGLLGWVRRRAA